DSLSIAIGKQGQNVRLASRLTGWHLDVISETRYNEGLQSGFQSLMNLTGMNDSLANLLFGKGYFSADDLSKASAEDLVQEIGISEDEACRLIEAAADSNEPEDLETGNPEFSADPTEAAHDDEITNDAEAEDPED
ncbi:MAG: transcription termination/antitermination protein NusA, partial [Desulfobacteraceae bacterium]|nr:transcription termination/antitermination protein NusA [Desulfobacteraceae bacterium]